MAIPATSFMFSVLALLRPSKSPHLVASAIGAIVLIFSCSKTPIQIFIFAATSTIAEDSRFLLVSIPIYIALFLILVFSFKDSSPNDPEEDIEHQFRFSRAIGIGSAFIAMTSAAVSATNDTAFWISYLAALIQLATFIIYSTIRLIREESESQVKIFQISFMMFMFLICFVYSLSHATLTDGIFSNVQGETKVVDRYGLTMIVFGTLWLVYEIYWIRRIWQIVEFRLREPPPAGHAQAN